MEPQHISNLITPATQQTEPTPIDTTLKAETFGLIRVGNETPEEVESIKKAIKAAQQFLSAIKQGTKPRWLTITGASGVGKTHLLVEVTKRVHGHSRAFYAASKNAEPFCYAQEGPFKVRWTKIIDLARDGDFGPFKRASRDWYKAIDDAGAEGHSNDGNHASFVINQWSKLADNRMGKWTFWTSNYELAHIASAFDTRIADRILREPNIHVDLSHVRSFAIRKLESSK